MLDGLCALLAGVYVFFLLRRLRGQDSFYLKKEVTNSSLTGGNPYLFLIISGNGGSGKRRGGWYDFMNGHGLGWDLARRYIPE